VKLVSGPNADVRGSPGAHLPIIWKRSGFLHILPPFTSPQYFVLPPQYFWQVIASSPTANLMSFLGRGGRRKGTWGGGENVLLKGDVLNGRSLKLSLVICSGWSLWSLNHCYVNTFANISDPISLLPLSAVSVLPNAMIYSRLVLGVTMIH